MYISNIVYLCILWLINGCYCIYLEVKIYMCVVLEKYWYMNWSGEFNKNINFFNNKILLKIIIGYKDI